MTTLTAIRFRRLIAMLAVLAKALLIGAVLAPAVWLDASAPKSAPEPFVVPAWAYPTDPPPGLPTHAVPGSAEPLHVPGSDRAFSRAQLSDLYAAPDWHPDSHPPMPDIVAVGRRPAVYACGYCHLPDGQGRVENAPLAGLSANYIQAQLRAFRSGERRSAWNEPQLPNALMHEVALAATEEEVATAARYFSSLPLTRRVVVMETLRVPTLHVAGWVYVPTSGAGTEALDERLIEVPMDPERHERRDAASAFEAYVPPGSTARGKRIAVDGTEAQRLPCASCHGDALKGSRIGPPLAGRSPSYVLRQLLAFRTGARNSDGSAPMKAVAAQMPVPDMVAVAAYVTTLEP